MSHNSANTKIYGNVDTSDVKAVLGLTSNTDDVGSLIRTAVAQDKVNKWAKWKPYQAIETDLPLESLRRQAGWNEFGNANISTGLYYGVKGAIGNMQATLTDIHTASFVYKGPNGATYVDSGVVKKECYRLSDFRHPTDNNYGYRSDATMDLMVSKFNWLGEVDNVVIVGADTSFTVDIKYSPHTTEEKKEMLSIEDFLLKDDQTSGAQLDPLACYPCVYITNNASGKSWLHCLYKGSATTAQTIGTTGEKEWKISVPTSVAANGTTGTMSIVLVKPDSGTTILPGMDINNWIEDNGGDAWAAYFCGTPDGCGISVSFSTGGSYGATVANGKSVLFTSVTASTIAFNVGYAFTKSYTGNLTVEIDALVEYTPSVGSKQSLTLRGTKSYTSVTGEDSALAPVYDMSFSTNEFLLLPGTITVTATVSTVIGLSEKYGTPATGTYIYSL